MNRSKDKRINKFKRTRIWPSILGLCIILIIFAGIALVVVDSYLLNVINIKFNESLELTKAVSELCEEYDVSNRSQINKEIEGYIKHNEQLEAVAVMTKDGKAIWSNNNNYPVVDKQLTYSNYYEDLGSFDWSSDCNVIIEEDNYHIFNESSESIYVSGEIISKIDYDAVFSAVAGSVDGRNEAVMHYKIWIAMPASATSTTNIYVLHDIYIRVMDVIMVVIVLALVTLLMLVFVVYYLFSIMSVFSSQQKLSKVIYTDMVTGGNNWLYFEKKCNKLLKRNRGKHNYAVINIRMAKYRSFCTCFGVKEGEELLEKFYNVLKRNLRRKDVFAHHDEADFGIMVAYEDKGELLHIINQLNKILGNVIPNIKMYFNFGVCIADNNDKNVNTLYNNATIARELLGDDSENKIAFFDIEMNKKQLWERKVEDEMDKALVTNQFKLYLQPKYSTKEEKLAGAEALVRWIHPVEGFISPNKFIPIFEKNGFILQLDDYMLEQVAKQQAKWMEEGRTLFPISVNVSRAHFTREDLAEHICTVIDKYNVPHSVIELELTESAFFDDKQVLINTVKKLREYGFIVSMDDFGAGYSSLNSLKELSIDVLKIDADFFRGAESIDRGMVIVSEVIDLAKKLNMKIVAEGIESRDQVDFLVAQECDLIQGFYYAKPMPVDEFEERYK